MFSWFRKSDPKVYGWSYTESLYDGQCINCTGIKNEEYCIKTARRLEDQYNKNIHYLRLRPDLYNGWLSGMIYPQTETTLDVFSIVAKHLVFNTTLKELEIETVPNYDDGLIELLSVVEKHTNIHTIVLQNYQKQASTKLTSVVAEMGRNPNSKITSLIMDGVEFRQK